MNKKKIEIDFTKCTKEECLRFAKMVVNDEIKEKTLKKLFYSFINNKYSEEDAINLIKNIIIIRYHVNLSKTGFLAYSGRLLLTAAKFINKKGSLNFKILYALCLTQFNPQHTDFIDNPIKEVIVEMNSRFYCLVNKEK
eukprot:jgi/Orpsp1_1/1188665/evm.model.d7180000066370.1